MNSQNHFFYVVKAPIDILLETEFLNTYLRSEGHFYSLLHQAPIDQTSSLSLIPGNKKKKKRKFEFNSYHQKGN